MKITYSDAGIDYAKIDPLKVSAQEAARSTASNLDGHGFREIGASRGESAYVVDMGDYYLASVTECLGTKSLVTDAMYRLTGESRYDLIAKDTVAMAVNDLISVGAAPMVVHAYWGTSGSAWFEDGKRASALVRGWKAACDESGASWGGGETPGLSGIVAEGACDLAASCVGIIRPKERLALGGRLADGDAIVLLESSGIHANGISLARALADRIEGGYLSRLDDGSAFGDALLVPTHLYARSVRAMFEAGVDIKYMSNITGHGWRKLMRHSSEFLYEIDMLPPVPPVLEYIARKAGLDKREAYGTFNMGAGFAVYLPECDADKAVAACASAGIKAWRSGTVIKGKRSVVIGPLGIAYEGESLKLRT